MKGSAGGFRVMLSWRIVLKIYWWIKTFLSPGSGSLRDSLKLVTLRTTVHPLDPEVLSGFTSR